MEKKFVSFSVVLLCVMSGCGTVDRVSGVSDRCEVHGLRMEAKVLKILPGYIGYLPEYERVMMHKFPHYDGPRWDHGSYVLGYRTMKVYVCEGCTEAYQAYHREHQANQPQAPLEAATQR